MPEELNPLMLATCGINCAVCYRRCMPTKAAKRCAGCLLPDSKNAMGRPAHCETCKIRACAASRGLTHCHRCDAFPCVLTKRLDKSYTSRYGEGVIANGYTVRDNGVETHMRDEREKWRCNCGGIISLHDGVCSECGAAKQAETE